MANRYAVATGNWSSLATWDGGVSLPGAGDSVRPNGFTVTIDQNITVTELIGNASSPAVAGGSFLFQNGRTITGNVVMATGGGTLISTTGSGSSRTIVGNVSSSVSGLGIYLGAGNVDGLTIVGNITSTGNGNCINGYDRLFLTITGNVSSTSTGRAIEDQTNAGTASISITGDVTSTSTAAAIYCNTVGTINITGTVTAGTTYAVFSSQALVIHNGNQVDGTAGHRAIHTTRLWLSSSVQTQYQIRTNNGGVVGSLRSLYTGGVNLNQPVVANVRSGTVYGAASEYTGTLAVPSPTLVAIGVATDNTVGSYAPTGGLDAAGVRTAIGLATANLDTQLSSIQSDTNDIQTRLPAALESGRIAAALDSTSILAVADQVWDEATSGHTTAGTYGGRIVRATNSNTEVQITGSNHIAADVHNLQSGVITAADFAANAITASALATDAVTEIQSGLATAAALATESGKITNIENASGYLLAVLAGACADPQTASETYAITVFGSTFTVDMAGQTSTGTRTAPTLTKV